MKHFKSSKQIDKFLLKHGYNKIEAEEEGWHFIVNDDMQLEISPVEDPQACRPLTCNCLVEVTAQKITSCLSCFEAGYQYAPSRTPIFYSEVDALNFVFRKALKGSKIHKFAIKTHFGSKKFNPFAVVMTNPSYVGEFHYCQNKKEAVQMFCDELAKWDVHATDEIIDLGYCQVDGIRVHLLKA